MTKGRKGLDIRSKNQNRSKEVWKCDKEWKEKSNRWRIEIAYHNQFIHLTSKASQNQQNKLQIEIIIGIGGVLLSYAT